MKLRRSAVGSRLTQGVFLGKLGSPLIVGGGCMSSEDYAKYARETFAQDRALIEHLGLLAK